jgi:hypothetical protein
VMHIVLFEILMGDYRTGFVIRGQTLLWMVQGDWFGAHAQEDTWRVNGTRWMNQCDLL